MAVVEKSGEAAAEGAMTAVGGWAEVAADGYVLLEMRAAGFTAAEALAAGHALTEVTAGCSCNRCGSDYVRCEQKQTRSADESMTIICTCSKCQLRWTMR